MQLSDEKILQITQLLYSEFRQGEENQKLDIDHLDEFKKTYIKPLYPHKKDEGSNQIRKYECCEVCCDVNPGRFCCCNSVQPDNAFRKFGLGICLYFKFLKHSAAFFMVLSIVAILSCSICVWVCLQNQINPISTYQNAIFSSTMGTISAERFKCKYAQISSSKTASLILTCPYGSINKYSSVFTTESSNSLFNCKNQIKKYQSNISAYSTSSSMASETASCNSANSECTISMTFSGSLTYDKVSYGYECINNAYALGKLSLPTSTVMYILIAIDLFFCFALLMFYISEVKAEHVEKDYFKQQQLALNDFTLEIEGFRSTSFNQEFNVFTHTLANALGPDFPHQMIQLKMPDKPEYLVYQRDKSEAYNKLFKFIVTNFFDQLVNPNIYKNQEIFISQHFGSRDQYEKYKDKLQKKLTNFMSVQYNTHEEEQKQISIYLVLANMPLKKRIYALREESCCDKFLNVNGKKYHLKDPPSPDLIIWKNIEKWTTFRVVLSWILTLAICFGSYMLFGYIQYKQNAILSEYKFDIDCSISYTTAQLLIYDSTLLSTSNSNYLTCYCKQHLTEFSSSSYSQCTSWLVQYITYLAIPFVISIGLVAYNVIVKIFFRLLSTFQCHNLITNQLYSYTIKRSFILIMNMGLIMIILNINYNASSLSDLSNISFLLLGKYSDITSDWYVDIGILIFLTMVFNISFPIIELLIANLFKCFRKCWDRKCFTRKTSKKTKKDYIQLFIDDAYPLEERYAFLIAVFIITMAFNCVIPALNVIAALSFFLLYLSDKLLLFKIYQTPLNFNSELHKCIKNTVFATLIIHMVVSVFLLSEPNMIPSGTTITSSLAFNSNNSRINSIIQTVYIIPYVCFLILLVLYVIFKATIINLFQKCSASCTDQASKISKYKAEVQFFSTLNHFQILKLKNSIEKEITKVASINKNKKLMNDSGFVNIVLNQSTKDLNAQKPNQHENILKRTYNRLKDEESLRKRQDNLFEAQLIGMPGYEIMINDDELENQKKNISLNSILSQKLQMERQRMMTEITNLE